MTWFSFEHKMLKEITKTSSQQAWNKKELKLSEFTSRDYGWLRDYYKPHRNMLEVQPTESPWSPTALCTCHRAVLRQTDPLQETKYGIRLSSKIIINICWYFVDSSSISSHHCWWMRYFFLRHTSPAQLLESCWKLLFRTETSRLGNYQIDFPLFSLMCV